MAFAREDINFENIKLKDDIQLLEKEKRWNMLWRNRLDDNIDKTQIVLAIVFSINILFTYFMSR